jgi:alkanesulfonate monooxygenase SsuD/methylene tetrahydromethanopterin reductase-like flavin-dependent oxidoreductase (luciferase family)
MEFGLFIQNFLPKGRYSGPDAEHQAILRDIEIGVAADRAGFKYVWGSEHHFLDEYSHMSASDTLFGYLAAKTERIHVGAAIFNPLPQVNHPVKVAEKVAYLDHLSEGRFEFGTGRGAGSHEILGFLAHDGITDTNATKEIWEETIGEFPKMFLQDVYDGFEGRHWSLPPRRILPKPYGPAHPAMWYAAGNPASYEMAARKGLGVLGFSVQEVRQLEPVLTKYKKTIADAEPIGAFVNDNIMITIPMFVAEDGRKARESAVNSQLSYLQSNVFRYHDTFPRPEGFPVWPDLMPDPTPDQIDQLISSGAIICGDPDEAAKQCGRWASAGADQLNFAVASVGTLEETVETVRLVGKHVIPDIDPDPTHSTTRYRATANA